jgi:hypothetical protein
MTNYIHSYYGTFTLDVKSVLNENLGGILGGILGLSPKWLASC